MVLADACLLALLVSLAATAVAAAAAQQGAGLSVFDPGAFADPPKEYRPLQMVHGFDRLLRDPAKLEGEAGIDERLAHLAGLGIGGIVANVGSGDYLASPRQWEVYRYGMRAADGMGLALWLYDEKGYPSGTAGGIVVRANPDDAAQGLACYAARAMGPAEVVQHLPLSCRAFEYACAFRADTQPTAATVLDLSDRVDEWGTLRWAAPQGDWTVLYMAQRVMYEGTFATAVPVQHAATRHYINTLDKDAVRAFLRVTHEQYARETPPGLWKHVRAVFTDEPLIAYYYTGSGPQPRQESAPPLDEAFFTDRPAAVPWANGLAEEVRRAKGYDLRPRLFALFASDAAEACYVRQDFWDVVTGMYSRAYFQQIADWCAGHGTALSGHVLAEENIWGNTMFEGSLFEAVRPMQVPGIDILTADPQAIGNEVFIAAKAVSSVAHLTGRKTVMCECCAFGALPSGQKIGLNEFIAQANMLQVMGVNLFTLYQNHGQIGEESFRRYTAYAGRLSLLLRGGSHVCDVAVLYPARSAWAYWIPSGRQPGPGPDTREVGRRFNQVAGSYVQVCRDLAQHQIDFDLVDERAIREAAMREGAMRIADEAYRVIVLAHPYALDLATAEALRAFCAAGGALVSVGQRPELTDSAANQAAFERLMDELFAEGGRAVVVPQAELQDSIRNYCGADLALAEPNACIFYTHRQRDGRELYFVVNNGAEAATVRPKLRVPGPYAVYRPLTGDVQHAGAEPELTLQGYEGAFLVAEQAMASVGRRGIR